MPLQEFPCGIFVGVYLFAYGGASGIDRYLRTRRSGGVMRRRKGTEEKGRIINFSLRNWRNFTKVDVDLQGRTYLVGPNASGKSNFLDAFRFLRDIASEGGGLQYAVQKREGLSSIRCLAARKSPVVMLKAHWKGEDNSVEWTYQIGLKQDQASRPFVDTEIVTINGEEILRRPDGMDSEDQERLRQTHLEQVNTNADFRFISDYFRKVRYLHLVPQIVKDPARKVIKKDPYGSDFIDQVADTNKRTRDSRLRRIAEMLRIAVPQLEELSLWTDTHGTPHLRWRYEHWRTYGAWQTETLFSDGSLRLVGLLWALLEGSGPLLLEEPELSLHPEIVRYIPQLFAKAQKKQSRQIIVSTHSADILRDSGIGLDEVFLLLPTREGTNVRPATTISQAEDLLKGGLSLADVVIPNTKPENAQQLSLFQD
jgi:predicted ATPase